MKVGINHMGYTMAAELTEHRINLNVIGPRWTDMPGEWNFATEEELREGGKNYHGPGLERLRTSEKAAAFLCLNFFS